MKKLKEKSALTIILGLIMVFSTSTYADISAEVYNSEKLKDIYINQSFEVKMIELDAELLVVQNKTKIEDYEKSKKNFQDVEDTMNAAKATREQSIYDAERARDQASIAAAAKNAEFALIQYIQARNQYRNRVREDVQLTQSVEPVIFELNNVGTRKENSIAKSEYALQVDYYKLVSLNRELELLNKDIEIMEKRISIDQRSGSMGTVTTAVIEENEKKLRDLQKQKRQLENNLESAIENMKTKLNIDVNRDLNIRYNMPTVSTLKSYKLQDSINQFMKNNLELALINLNVDIKDRVFNKLTMAFERLEEYNENEITLKQQEDEQTQIKIAEIEHQKIQIQQYNLERSLEQYAKQTYFEYQLARDTLFDNILFNNNLYQNKMNKIQEQLKQGIISEFEYESQKQQLNKELNKLENDIITYLNTKSKIELLLKGIML